jgi:hypothetical protein
VNRFPVFADLVKENRPNLIIGAGVSHLSDYFACFAGSVGLKTAISVGKLEPISEANSKTRSYYYAELNNETILAVVPFYSGTNGLNSYHLLSEMGKRLKQITQGQNLN